MVEDIPPGDDVSRYIDSPHKWSSAERKVIDSTLFEFPRPEEVESVVWRKYAPHLDDVHALGCERQKLKRETKPSWTYEGAITARVAEIRQLKNIAGDGFTVVHAPDEGRYHAHIGLAMAGGDDRIRQRKSDLKERLRGVFSQPDAHVCPL